jgi:hypothetical protein
MSPQDALRILDGICANVNLTRQQHSEVQRAVMTLAQAINPKPDTADKAD